MKCLEALSPKRADENRVKIRHKRGQSTNEIFSSIFVLNLGHRIFSHTDNLSKNLQAKKMSACTSKRLAKLTIQLLQNMRNDHSFNSFCDTVVKKSTECEFIKDPINPRKRKSPNYSTMHLVEPLVKHKFFTQPHVKIATE